MRSGRFAVLALGVLALNIQAAGAPAASAQEATGKARQALSYRGIVPGQSRREDVLRIFGTPSRSGPGGLEELPERKFEELGFRTEGDASESVFVLFEPGSDVVFAIQVLMPLAYTKQDLLKAYGKRYVIRDPYKDRCSIEKFVPGKNYDAGLDEPQDSDASYVYANGRLVAFVDGGGQVEELKFWQRCPPSTR
jgi:hypothetical protein